MYVNIQQDNVQAFDIFETIVFYAKWIDVHTFWNSFHILINMRVTMVAKRSKEELEGTIDNNDHKVYNAIFHQVHDQASMMTQEWNVIPNLMNWITYPLTSVIDMIWKKHLPKLQSSKKLNLYHIEFVTLLECTLNYMHTGSAKVLSKAIMQPHFLALGAIHKSLLCLNPQDLLKPKPQLHITTQYWKRNNSCDRCPLWSSKHIQELIYGKSHMQQSEARFVIFDVITHLDMCMSNDKHVEKQNLSSNKLYQHVFEVAFKIYIEDVKEFVKNAIQKELEPLSWSRDFAAKQSARECRHNNPAEPRNHEDMAPLTFPAPPGGSWFQSQYVDAIVKGAFKQLHPFIQHSMFKHTVSELASNLICTLRQLWTHDPDKARDIMKAIMITHTVWLPLGEAEPKKFATMSHVLLDTIWSVTHQCLTNYYKVLHKQYLPSEWAYKNASIQAKNTLLKEVYMWLSEVYDPINKPLHSLTMMQGPVAQEDVREQAQAVSGIMMLPPSAMMKSDTNGSEQKEYGLFNTIVKLIREHTAHHLLLKEQWINICGPVNMIVRHDPIMICDQEINNMYLLLKEQWVNNTHDPVNTIVRHNPIMICDQEINNMYVNDNEFIISPLDPRGSVVPGIRWHQG
ncbi:hypothetical protein EV363DRAFT_1293421 [Boletus edulis]|nr:hypothetical protein EV363DRAFT_1293421 [Boletus edulis]